MYPLSRTQTGATLIELIMSLTLVAILAGLALPSLGRFVAHARIREGESSLLAALHHAREAAVQDMSMVVFCPSVDGRHCRSGYDWDDGWLIALDRDEDGWPDEGTAPLAVGDALDERVNVITSRGRPRVHYRPDGSAPGSNTRFIICEHDDGHGANDGAVSLVISNSGRIRRSVPDSAHVSLCTGAE